MPLAKLDARLINIDRIIEWGKRDKLQVVDPVTREVVADIRLWNWEELNPIGQDAPTYKFTFGQDPTTKELLPSCLIAFNGVIHDVVVRRNPKSVSGVLWEFRTRPSNEVVEE